jgi:CheY-like chemotaxis protein
MLLANTHIFIVEDNLQNRIIYELALRGHGALLEFERWGKGAVSRLQGLLRYDLIIMDLMLAGGVSGFDIYDEIRTLPKFSNVPIVAVSAMEPAVAIPKARMKGFAGFIAKPIDSRIFAQQIAQIINGENIWYTSSWT